MGINRKLQLGIAGVLWGWVPHETQREWLLCDAQTKVASCGRRWGKTEAAAIDAAIMAITSPGSVQMIVSPTYDQSRLIFDSVERLVMGSSLTRHLVKVVKTPYPKITILGSTIMARTADEDGRNLRGHSADRVIVDEAAYVRDKVIYEVISPMLADRNGRLVMISTPFGKNHFYQAFVRGAEGREKNRYASFSFPSWTNPHISKDYIDLQREVLSPRQFAVEYEAQFVDEQSSVFVWDDIQAAVERGSILRAVDGLFETCDALLGKFDAIVAGIDWARYSDYTAVIAVGVNESGCCVVGIDRFNNLGWSSQIERVVEFLKTYRVSAVLTDQTSIGDPLLEQLKAKLCESSTEIAVEGYNFTNASKRELIEHLALRFAHGTIAIPGKEDLLKELQFFEYELTESGNVRMNARSGFHDDLVMALALACRQAKEVGYMGPVLRGRGRVTAAGW